MSITVIVAGVIIMFGGFIQALSGFGLGLFTVGLFSLFLEVKFAVVLTGIFGWLVTLPIIIFMRKHIDFKEALILGFFAIPGAIFGAELLANLNSKIITLAIGTVLIFAGLQKILMKKSYKPNKLFDNSFTRALAGLLSGALGVTGGPPVIAYFSFKGWSNQKFKATISFFFFIQMIFVMLSFYNKGLITTEVTTMAVKIFLFFVMGSFIGYKLFYLIQNTKIDYIKIISILLMLSGINLIFSVVR